MSKKKNKKYTSYDIDSYDQQLMLQELNDALDSGIIIDSTPDEEEYDNSDMMSDIESYISSSLNIATSDDEDDKPEVFTFEDYSLPQTNNDTLAPVENTQNISVKKTDNSSLYEFKMEMSDNEFKIFTLTDGIKRMDIDLNSLEEDDMPYDPDESYTDFKQYAFVMITQILTNFYPSAIMPIDKISSVFKNIEEVSCDNFIFYEYPDGSGKIILGYYISNESIKNLDNIIYNLIETRRIKSFLYSLDNLTTVGGFSFRWLTDSYSKQLMLLKSYNISTDEFIELIKSDEYTVYTEGNTSSIWEATTVYPFEYTDAVLNNLLSNFHDNNDEDDDEEDIYESDDEEVIPDETDTEIKVAEVTVTETVETEEILEESPEIVEEDELLPDAEDIVEDPEELEEMYFNNRRENRKFQEKVYPQKKPNKPDNDDGLFTVARRK